MLIRWKHVVKRSVLQARRRGILRGPVDATIDMHDIPFYGKVINMFCAVKSNGESGTTRFNRLAALHCVVNGSRLTLGVEVVRKGENNAEAVRLLQAYRRHRVADSTRRGR